VPSNIQQQYHVSKVLDLLNLLTEEKSKPDQQDMFDACELYPFAIEEIIKELCSNHPNKKKVSDIRQEVLIEMLEMLQSLLKRVEPFT
jgi:hypothetical protein